MNKKIVLSVLLVVLASIFAIQIYGQEENRVVFYSGPKIDLLFDDYKISCRVLPHLDGSIYQVQEKTYLINDNPTLNISYSYTELPLIQMHNFISFDIKESINENLEVKLDSDYVIEKDGQVLYHEQVKEYFRDNTINEYTFNLTQQISENNVTYPFTVKITTNYEYEFIANGTPFTSKGKREDITLIFNESKMNLISKPEVWVFTFHEPLF